MSSTAQIRTSVFPAREDRVVGRRRAGDSDLGLGRRGKGKGKGKISGYVVEFLETVPRFRGLGWR